MSTTEDVMEKIKREKLKPTARWCFVLKYSMLWIFGFLSVVLGSIAFALVIFTLAHGEIAEYSLFHTSPFGAFLQAVPVLWILCFGIFLVVAYMLIRNTKRGYRFHFWTLVFVSVLCSAVLGSVLHFAGVSRATDRMAGKMFSGYHSVEQKRIDRWMRPGEGRIIGEVERIVPAENVLLRDPHGEVWRVVFANENTWFVAENIRTGTIVGVVGHKTAELNFLADRIKIFPNSGDAPFWKGDSPRPFRERE